jgi:hypothetical protein
MKDLICTLVGSSLALGAVAYADPASAQFRGLRDAVRDVKKATDDAKDVAETAEDAADAVSGERSSRRSRSGFANRGSTSNSPTRAARAGHVGGAAAAPSRLTGQLSCASLGIGNAFIGRDGEYTFSKGISTEERSGIVDRRNVTPTSNCMFEGLAVGDILYVEFDKKRFNDSDYEMQCVSFDGSEQLNRSTRPRVNNYKGKDVMLHTGNSLGYTPTASGTNSSRSGAYDSHLSQRGREMATINFTPLHTDKSGTDFYCQWYSEKTGKSALGLTFRRGPQR